MSFASDLLTWYEENRRHLPWREDPTPYHVYLSETMLQQTRVDTVGSYYTRFLERFPDFLSLANAEEEEVLALWQGLGYYSRAKNLHKAAKIVASVYGGELPKDKTSLLRLPGVGGYMANAVLAIAFDQKEVAVDGNLLRVYSRLEAKNVDITKTDVRENCAAYFQKRIESPSSFNQALMDLGEMVCLPHGTPKCEQCPLRSHCKARANGNPSDYPPKKKKPSVKEETLTVLLIFDSAGRIQIRKRPETGLLASLYEFPNLSGHLGVCDLVGRYPQVTGLTYLGKETHRFSHILWTMHVYIGTGSVDGCLPASLDEIGSHYSVPTAFAKLLQKPLK